jgi:hypothetical protein
MATKISYATLYPNTHVEGFEEVINNLNAAIAKIEGGSEKGLKLAAAMIREDTEKTSPITPMDLGNLASSWFIVTWKGKMANDKLNVGFKDKGKTKIAGRMSANHVSTIEEARAEATAQEEMGNIVCIMGYSAFYAVFVHENLEAEFKRPGSGPKWFEYAVDRNKGKILQIIKDNVEIK